MTNVETNMHKFLLRRIYEVIKILTSYGLHQYF